MIVELISTGSELLLGDTVNTNVSWLAQELNKLGAVGVAALNKKRSCILIEILKENIEKIKNRFDGIFYQTVLE